MSIPIPKEIAYSQKLASLPAGTQCTSIVVAPSNGSVFSSGGNVIYFDMPARGYLVPSSMYLRYNLQTNATAAGYIKGTPFSAPFLRSEVLIGSQIIESIQQYNQLYNIMVNTKLSIGQKMGMAATLGYVDNGTNTMTSANLNGRFVSSGDIYALAGPLGNILSNADHLVPLGMMPSCRIQLTTDTVSNIFNSSITSYTNVPSSFLLGNLELCFDVIDFGPDVDSLVQSMADADGNIFIKSQSFTSANQTVASGTSGTVELVYNQRLSSIKSLIANIGTSSSYTTISSVDITNNKGDYQFIVAGTAYPQRPISTLINKAGAFMELMNCWGPAHDLMSSNTSITPADWQCVTSATANSSSSVCGKFYVGTNVEKLSTNGALLTGISSQLSPISFRINMGSQSSAEAHTVTLICNYDALLVINLATRQASVKQ